jgi:hypothetical protein
VSTSQNAVSERHNGRDKPCRQVAAQQLL